MPVTADNKVETLAELLAQERGLALVFVRTKRGADRLVQKLARHDVTAVAMHGDMNQNQRERALKRFENGHGQDARRHRRRRPRPRPRRHHARDQLRSAGGAHRLRPPRRPHRPRRARTARASRSSSPSSRPRSATSRGCSGTPRRSSSQGMTVAPPRLVYAVEAAQLQVGPVPAPPQDLAQSFWASPPRDARHGCARGYSHRRIDSGRGRRGPLRTSPTRRSPRQGEQRIRWVAKHSPVLNRLARERLADGALRGQARRRRRPPRGEDRVPGDAARRRGRAGRRLRLEPRLDAGRDLRRARRARDRGARAPRRLARASSTPTCSRSPTPSRRSSSTTAPS